MDTKYKIEMKDITKSFGGVVALSDVSFRAVEGEAHAIVGENGAGKSTLIKILSGAYQKDEGEIFLDGTQVSVANPREGHKLGISVIYQEFALAQDLTVAENIFLDDMGQGKRFVDWKKLYNDAQQLLSSLGFENINVNETVENLSVAYQQIVEICKALSRDSKVLVFDEPTAVLASNEEEQLFRIIEHLKSEGVCIIYISHRMDEIFRICETITVMKDGKNVDTVKSNAITKEQLVNMMVGRDLSEMFPPRNAVIGETVLRAENLNKAGKVNNVSLEVRQGEILGINGLVGAGRTETMQLLFGVEKMDDGVVYISGEKKIINSPKNAVANGLGMLTEDRKRTGVLLEIPIRDNITITTLKKISGKSGWINKNIENEMITDIVGKLHIKLASIDNDVASLSGGNQQKVALAKWLLSGSKVLILDEPTRGVDVGAKVEIYKIINSLAEEGVAIIMISSEMPEIIGMSDRVIVMREGRVMGEISEPNAINEENLIKLSMGVM